jgi:ornithine cyclodeaminase/alanine dehydrogenase-like protein (mu-crystallin family)
MLVLNRHEVESLLDMDRLVETLGPAMVELSAGGVSMPPRVVAQVREWGGLLAAMPAYLGAAQILSAKLVSVFPENPALGLPSHQAVILVFDPHTGTPRAMMDGTAITALRTAAGSALATRLLARPEACILAIVGTGVQARAHAKAIPRVRPIKEIRVVGRNRGRAVAMAEEIARGLGILTKAPELGQGAFAGADVICVTTHSAEPVLRGEWLEPGAHVNSVGLNPNGRELDGEAVRGALVVVETRGAALAPAPSGSNDLLWALRDGLIGEEHIHAEIGELISGARPGRTSPDQITLYKSVGVAVQDAVAAHLVLELAEQRGVGREVGI